MAEALGAQRYIQSHTCAAELNQLFADSRHLAPPYDGITEAWWDSVEDLKAAMATSAGAEAMSTLVTNESRSIDFSQSCAFMSTEHSIFDSYISRGANFARVDTQGAPGEQET